MKEMDLMYAMTELDDELLERESGGKVKRFRFVKVAAVAAALALMTVTVFAAVVGVEHWFTPQDENNASVNLSYSFPYKQVVIRQEAYDELTQQLNMCWEEWIMQERCGVQCSAPDTTARLTSMVAVEEFMGLDLLTSPEIEALANGNLAVNAVESSHITLFGPAWDDAYAEYEERGCVSLLGIEISISLNEDDSNGFKYIDIIIPLDERYMEYYPDATIYGFGNIEEQLEEEYNNGSRDFLIAKKLYTDEEGAKCAALYTQDGVCYSVRAMAWPIDPAKTTETVLQDSVYEFCLDAEELVLPLIENIK